MIFNINIKSDYEKRRNSFILSLFIPGLGQIIHKRLSGIFFIIVYILLISFLLHLHKNSIFTNGLIFIGFFILYIINLIDAFFGPYRKKAPCQIGCPANINIPEYIGLIADRRFEEAKAIIKRRMPLVSICGTICPAPCEIKCLRKGYDESIMIMDLKKTTIKYKESIKDLDYIKTNKRVAIIGAGPGGLSLAYFLAKKGIRVTIYEKEQEAGGVLRYGVPKYRLDMLDLLMDIESILSHNNITFVNNKIIGKDYPLKSISQDYDFVVLAIGSHKPIKIFDNINSPNIIHGLELLEKIAKNIMVSLGKDVVVIGGGNVAIDVARTVKRLGSNVIIYYRRSKELMRAIPEEMKMAEEEGIKIITNASVDNIKDINNRLEISMKINDEERIINADTFICATGQKANLSQFDENILLGKNFKTNIKNIYNLKDSGTVVGTVKNAQEIARFLSRKIFGLKGIIYNIMDNINYYPQLREINDAAWNYKKPRKISRVNTNSLSIEKRQNSFFKVKRDLTVDEAVEQAKRCMRCHTKSGLPFIKQKIFLMNKKEKIN